MLSLLSASGVTILPSKVQAIGYFYRKYGTNKKGVTKLANLTESKKRGWRSYSLGVKPSQFVLNNF